MRFRFSMVVATLMTAVLAGSVHPATAQPPLPALVWSTYLGGTGQDEANSVALDRDGNSYIVGRSAAVVQKNNFPIIGGRQRTQRGGGDVVLVKLKATGRLEWSTFFGGSDSEDGTAVAVDPAGNVFITGSTLSANFPTLRAWQSTRHGSSDVFVAKFNARGVLLWSTFFGGGASERGSALAMDAHGNVYVTGMTTSVDLPVDLLVQAPAQAQAGGGTCGGVPYNLPCTDAFVAKFSANGALLWSTYLGGDGDDQGQAIATDQVGNVYVTGVGATNFPLLNPLDAVTDKQDGFVTKLTADGALLWSTFLGGNNFDTGTGIALDNAGNPVVTGETYANDFPTVHALEPAFDGGVMGFVAKLSTHGDTLLWSTFLPGSGAFGQSIAVDTADRVYVVGDTYSLNFPSVQPIQASNAGESDMFVARLSSNGTTLEYGTYLGGSNLERGKAIAVGGTGRVVITGLTRSTDVSVVQPYQSRHKGEADMLIARMDVP